MSPFRTTADMPGFEDRTNPEPEAARISIPAFNGSLDAVPPSAPWWQRWGRKISPAMRTR